MKEEMTEDEEKKHQDYKDNWGKKEMGRVAAPMGGILKMKRKRVIIQSKFVL